MNMWDQSDEDDSFQSFNIQNNQEKRTSNCGSNSHYFHNSARERNWNYQWGGPFEAFNHPMFQGGNHFKNEELCNPRFGDLENHDFIGTGVFSNDLERKLNWDRIHQSIGFNENYMDYRDPVNVGYGLGASVINTGTDWDHNQILNSDNALKGINHGVSFRNGDSSLNFLNIGFGASVTNHENNLHNPDGISFSNAGDSLDLVNMRLGLGPLRFLPSHDGAVHFETPDVHINGPVHHEYIHTDVDEVKKTPSFKPGQTLLTPYGRLKLVPVDDDDKDSVNKGKGSSGDGIAIIALTASLPPPTPPATPPPLTTISQSQSITSTSAASDEPIKVQLALDPDALKALNGANSAAGDSSPATTNNNNNYGGSMNGGLGTLEALALGALLSGGARAPSPPAVSSVQLPNQSGPPVNNGGREKNAEELVEAVGSAANLGAAIAQQAISQTAVASHIAQASQTALAAAQQIAAQQTLSKAASDAANAASTAIGLMNAIGTIGSNSGGGASGLGTYGLDSGIGGGLETGGGDGAGSLASTLVGLVSGNTLTNDNSGLNFLARLSNDDSSNSGSIGEYKGSGPIGSVSSIIKPKENLLTHKDGSGSIFHLNSTTLKRHHVFHAKNTSSSRHKLKKVKKKRMRRTVDKASHGLLREVFSLQPSSKSGIEALTANPNFPTHPDTRGNLEEFDAPKNVGDQYGQRILGWFLAPQSGKYIFYSSCDDSCEIYISQDDDPKNKKIIIAQDDWSRHNEWDKYPAQQTSKTIDLQGEHGYYIEALMSDTKGEDHLSVGVRLPDGKLLRPIPNYLLSPVRIVTFPQSFVTLNEDASLKKPELLLKNKSLLLSHAPALDASEKRDKTHLVPKRKLYQTALKGALENLSPVESIIPNTRVQIPRRAHELFLQDTNVQKLLFGENGLHANSESNLLEESVNKVSSDLKSVNLNVEAFSNGLNIPKENSNNFIDTVNSDVKSKLVNSENHLSQVNNVTATINEKPEFIPAPISENELKNISFNQFKNLTSDDDGFYAPSNAEFKKIKEKYGENPDYEDSFQYDDTDHHVGIINVGEELKADIRNVENFAQNLIADEDDGVAYYSGRDKSLVINDNQAIEMKHKYSSQGKVVLDFSKGNEYAKIIIYDLRRKPVERKSHVIHPAKLSASKSKNKKKHKKQKSSKSSLKPHKWNKGNMFKSKTAQRQEREKQELKYYKSLKKDIVKVNHQILFPAQTNVMNRHSFENNGFKKSYFGFDRYQNGGLGNNIFGSDRYGRIGFESNDFDDSNTFPERSLLDKMENSLLPHPGVNLWIFDEIYQDKALKESLMGALYHSVRYPAEPDQVFGLPLMDAGQKIGNNVGQMIWGWLISPMDGEYTFFSSCDDACDVYMSPDESKQHLRKIISQRRWSMHNQWDKYPEEQTSPLIKLSGGKAYFIQAVCVQVAGSSGCSVGMRLPNGIMSRPIKGEFLSRTPVGPEGDHVVPDFATAQIEQVEKIHNSVGEQAPVSAGSGLSSLYNTVASGTGFAKPDVINGVNNPSGLDRQNGGTGIGNMAALGETAQVVSTGIGNMAALGGTAQDVSTASGNLNVLPSGLLAGVQNSALSPANLLALGLLTAQRLQASGASLDNLFASGTLDKTGNQNTGFQNQGFQNTKQQNTGFQNAEFQSAVDFTQLQHDMAALAGYNEMSKHQYNELDQFTKHRFDTGKDSLESSSDLITNLLRLSNILMGRELGDSAKKKHHQKHAGISKSEISKTLHTLLRKIKKLRQKALMRETLEKNASQKKPHSRSLSSVFLSVLPKIKSVQNLVPQKRVIGRIYHRNPEDPFFKSGTNFNRDKFFYQSSPYLFGLPKKVQLFVPYATLGKKNHVYPENPEASYLLDSRWYYSQNPNIFDSHSSFFPIPTAYDNIRYKKKSSVTKQHKPKKVQRIRTRRSTREKKNLTGTSKKDDVLHIFSSNESRSQYHLNTVLFGDRSSFQIPQHVTHITQEQRFASHANNVNDFKLDQGSPHGTEDVKIFKEGKSEILQVSETFNSGDDKETKVSGNYNEKLSNVSSILTRVDLENITHPSPFTTGNLDSKLKATVFKSVIKVTQAPGRSLENKTTNDFNTVVHANGFVPDVQQRNNAENVNRVDHDTPPTVEDADRSKSSKKSLQLESVSLYREKKDLNGKEDNKKSQDKRFGINTNAIIHKRTRNHKTLEHLQLSREEPESIIHQFHDFAAALPQHYEKVDSELNKPTYSHQLISSRSLVSRGKTPVLKSTKRTLLRHSQKAFKNQNTLKNASNTQKRHFLSLLSHQNNENDDYHATDKTDDVSSDAKTKSTIPFTHYVTGDIRMAIEVPNPVKSNFVSHSELPEIIGTDGTGSMERIDISHMRAPQPESFSPVPAVSGPTLNGLPLLQSSQIGSKTTVFDLNLSSAGKSSILQLPGTPSQVETTNPISRSAKTFKLDDKSEESFSVTPYGPVSSDGSPINIPMMSATDDAVMTASSKDKEPEIGIDVAPSKSELSRESAVNSNPLTKESALHKNIYKEVNRKWNPILGSHKVKPSALVINNSKIRSLGRSLLSDARKSTSSGDSKFDWLFNEKEDEEKEEGRKDRKFKFKENPTLEEENDESDDDRDENRAGKTFRDSKGSPLINDIIMSKERDVDKILREEMHQYGKNSRKTEDDKWDEEAELAPVPNSKIFDYENDLGSEKDDRETPMDDFHPSMPSNVNSYGATVSGEYRNEQYNNPEIDDVDQSVLNNNHHVHHSHQEEDYQNNKDNDYKHVHLDDRSSNNRNDINDDDPHFEILEKYTNHHHARSNNYLNYEHFDHDHRSRSSSENRVRLHESHVKRNQDVRANKRNNEPVHENNLESFKTFVKEVANHAGANPDLFEVKKIHSHDITKRNREVRRTINGLVHIYNSFVNEKNGENKNHVHKFKSPLSLKFERAKKRSENHERLDLIKAALKYLTLQKAKNARLPSVKTTSKSDLFYPAGLPPKIWRNRLNEPHFNADYVINKYLTGSDDSKRLEHILKNEVYNDAILEITNLLDNKRNKKKKLKVEQNSKVKNLEAVELALKQLSAAAEKNTSKEYEDFIRRISPYLGKLKEISSKMNKTEIKENDRSDKNFYSLKNNENAKEDFDEKLNNATNVPLESRKELRPDVSELELDKVADGASNLQETKEELITALEAAQAISQKHINNVETHKDVTSYGSLLHFANAIDNQRDNKTAHMLRGDNAPPNENVYEPKTSSKQTNLNKTSSLNIQLKLFDDIGLAPQPIPIVENIKVDISPEKITLHQNKSAEESTIISNTILGKGNAATNGHIDEHHTLTPLSSENSLQSSESMAKTPPSLLQFSKPNYFGTSSKNFYDKNCNPVADGVEIPYVPPCNNLNTLTSLNPAAYTESVKIRPINHIFHPFKFRISPVLPVSNVNYNHYRPNMQTSGANFINENHVPVDFLTSYAPGTHYGPSQPTRIPPMTLDTILLNEAAETPTAVFNKPWGGSFHKVRKNLDNVYPVTVPLSHVSNGDALYNSLDYPISKSVRSSEGYVHLTDDKTVNSPSFYKDLDSNQIDNQYKEYKGDLVKNDNLFRRAKFSIVKKLPVVFKFFDDSDLGENEAVSRKNDRPRDYEPDIGRRINSLEEKLFIKNESEKNEGVETIGKSDKKDEIKLFAQNEKKKDFGENSSKESLNGNTNLVTMLQNETEDFSGDSGDLPELFEVSGNHEDDGQFKDNSKGKSAKNHTIEVGQNFPNKKKANEQDKNSTFFKNLQKNETNHTNSPEKILKLGSDILSNDGNKTKVKTNNQIAKGLLNNNLHNSSETSKSDEIDKKKSSPFSKFAKPTLHVYSKKQLKSNRTLRKYIRPPISASNYKHQSTELFSFVPYGFVPYGLWTGIKYICDRPPVALRKDRTCVGVNWELCNKRNVNKKCKCFGCTNNEDKRSSAYNRELHSFGLLHNPELLNSFSHSGHCRHSPEYIDDAPYYHHGEEENDCDNHHDEHDDHDDHECEHSCNHEQYYPSHCQEHEPNHYHDHDHHHHHHHECCHHGDSCYREEDEEHSLGGVHHCIAHPSEAHPVYYCGPNMDPQHIGQRGHHGESGLGGEGPYHGTTYHERECHHKNPLPVPVIIKPPPPHHGQNPYEILTTSQMHNGYHPDGYFHDTALIQMQNPHSTFGRHDHSGPIYAVPIKNQLTYPDSGSDKNYERRCVTGSRCKSKDFAVEKDSIFDLINKVSHRTAPQQDQSMDVKEEEKKIQQKALKSSYAILKKLNKMTAELKKKQSKQTNKAYVVGNDSQNTITKYRLPPDNPSDKVDYKNDELLQQSDLKSNTMPLYNNYVLNSEELDSSHSNKTAFFSPQSNDTYQTFTSPLNETYQYFSLPLNGTNSYFTSPTNETYQLFQTGSANINQNTSATFKEPAVGLFENSLVNLTTEHFYYLENGNQTISVPSMNYNETVPASTLLRELEMEKKIMSDPVTDLLRFSINGVTSDNSKNVKQEAEKLNGLTKKFNAIHSENKPVSSLKMTYKKRSKKKLRPKKYSKHGGLTENKTNMKSNQKFNKANNEQKRKKRIAKEDDVTDVKKMKKGQLLAIEKNILKLVLNMTNILLSQDQTENTRKLSSPNKLTSHSNFHEFVLLVDVSSAIDEIEFTLIQQFVGDFVSKLMNDTEVLVSVVSFGQLQRVDALLSNNPQKVQLAISSMRYMGGLGNFTSALMFVSDNIFQVGKRKTGVQQLCVILGGAPYYIQNIAVTADKIKSQGVEIFTVGIGSAFKTNSLLSDVSSIPIPSHTLYTDYENLLLTSNLLHDKIKKGWFAFIAKKKKKMTKMTETKLTNKHATNKTGFKSLQERCEACRQRMLIGLGKSKATEVLASKICFSCYENQKSGSSYNNKSPLHVVSTGQDLESELLYQNPVITAISEGRVAPGQGIGLAYAPLTNAPYQPMETQHHHTLAKVVYDGPNSEHEKLEVLDPEELLHYQEQQHAGENHLNQVYTSEKYNEPFVTSSHFVTTYDSSHVPHYGSRVSHAAPPLTASNHLISAQKAVYTSSMHHLYPSAVLENDSKPPIVAMPPFVERVEQNPYEVLVSEQLKPKYKPIVHDVHHNEDYRNNDHLYELHHKEVGEAHYSNQGNILIPVDQSVQLPISEQTFEFERPASSSYLENLEDLSSETEMMYPLKKRRLRDKSLVHASDAQILIPSIKKLSDLEKKSKTRQTYKNKVSKTYSKHSRKRHHLRS